MSKKIVVIIGRPNVGKSTLFNRLIGRRDAIVDSQSGVTRDRRYGIVEWNGKTFTIVDTGGFLNKSDDIFFKAIKKQIDYAINEADILLFVTDITTGITNLDDELAKKIRKSRKKTFLIVNKVDNSERYFEISEFYKLGFTEVFPVSSINGNGTGELLDKLIELLPNENNNKNNYNLPKFAIVGRPNVGKSSLLNTLLGKERAIVTPIAGTTRDSIDTRFNAFNFDFLLIDTAGIRKRKKVDDPLEFYSVLRTIRAIDRSDVCLLMLDAQEGISAQDLHIFSIIEKKKKGIVILVNKWDLIDKNKDEYSSKEYSKKIKKRIMPFNDVPIIFTSVLKKQRILKAFEKAIEVYKNRQKRVPTSKLNEVIHKVIEQNHPPAYKGKYIKIKYATQLPSKTPVFAFFCNYPKYIKEPYKRYLENKIRENFNFTGVPIRLVFREK